jgi:nucleoid-associated protein YgaU
MSRYNIKERVINENSLYSEQFENRNVSSIVQHKIEPLRYPTEPEDDTIVSIAHRWRSSDRLHRLAHENYGDFRMWWIIAQYNKIGSELELQEGQVILIPRPISIVLQYLR